MLEDAILKNGNHQKMKGDANRYYQQEEIEYSGGEEYEYEVQQQQPMSLEQQKEELKRKLQMISSKSKPKANNR